MLHTHSHRKNSLDGLLLVFQLYLQISHRDEELYKTYSWVTLVLDPMSNTSLSHMQKKGSSILTSW